MITKKNLAILIREAAKEALEEFDRGDVELHQSSKADQLILQTEQNIDALKTLARTLYKKQDGVSIQLLRAMNVSLSGFVQKVTTAVRAGKF